MSALEQARRLLRMARKDLKAMNALAAPDAYEPETFGFHAQQAVEKTLKAWLAFRNVSYAPTHNLRYLLDALQQSGCDVSDLWRLLELGPFAVQFRYEAYDSLELELDTNTIREHVVSLINQVEALLLQAENDKGTC